MKTKNIFKTLAFAMMMPAMLLTTACSSEDELANNKNIDNTEAAINKGFSLPVTVNVTRQGDSDMRAVYNESTRKLEFSAGDQLFVSGFESEEAYSFAGVLDYDAVSGKFSGTIYTENEYSGTADALFTAAASNICATLLPAGYKDHGYLVINTNDPDAQYDDFIEESNEYTLATSKADGVAQFSYEESTEYSSGFALAPKNAILNFTITGLAASTSVNVSLTSMAYIITGTVTTDASGNATFAAGINDGLNLQPFSLTVGDKNITIVCSDKDVAKGKIYNITRSAAPAPSYTMAAAEWCSAWNTSTPVTGADWLLASKDQWNYMLGTDGAGSYTDLRDGFWSVGGSNMKKGHYWSSTEKDTDYAEDYYFGNFGGGQWFSSYKNSNNYYVRACLAF